MQNVLNEIDKTFVNSLDSDKDLYLLSHDSVKIKQYPHPTLRISNDFFSEPDLVLPSKLLHG